MKFKEFVENFKHDKISKYVDLYGDCEIIECVVNYHHDSWVYDCYLVLRCDNMETKLNFKIVSLNKNEQEICDWWI